MSRLYIFKLEEDFCFKSEEVCKQLEEDLEFYCDRPKLRLVIATRVLPFGSAIATWQ